MLGRLVIRGKYGNHIFHNSTSFKRVLGILEDLLLVRDDRFQNTSIFLFAYLQNFSISRSWMVRLDNPQMYRRCGANISPLSITGSFGSGGRCHIGTAQTNRQARSVFGDLGKPRSAIYLSDNKVTARLEYGDVGMTKSTAKTYRVYLRKRNYLNLIDLDRAIDDLDSVLPIMVAQILREGGSLGAQYMDVKKVIPTQIFGHWLMSIAPAKTDGFIFTSACDKVNKNYCLFLRDDGHSSRVLEAHLL